jgi:Na+-driven multidrug efflux pump
MGITQGMLPFIAYNYAAKNAKRMNKGIVYMFVVAVGFSLVAITFFQIFTKQLVTFFVPGQTETIRYGVDFLHIIEVAVPLCSVCFLAFLRRRFGLSAICRISVSTAGLKTSLS